MSISSFALLLVVFLDLVNQGLVLPVLTSILLDPSLDFLPTHTTAATRQVDYGVVMGTFFLSWFLGAAYISRISDSIGRRRGILICLFGNLLGYGLTITALFTDSLVLLIAARAISGFTGRNQPIAQAAFIDMCETEQQKVRAMSLVVMSASLGLVAGPAYRRRAFGQVRARTVRLGRAAVLRRLASGGGQHRPHFSVLSRPPHRASAVEDQAH